MNHFPASSHGQAFSEFSSAIIWERSHIPGVTVAALSDHRQFEMADLCEALSTPEREKASAIADPTEKRHYVFKRCFQRVFVHTVIKWEGALSSLQIKRQLDHQPMCVDSPVLQMSFSSSGFMAVACASVSREVGIDIERKRDIENVGTLARRFFTPGEADAILALPLADQNLGFLRLWTAKEAGLKAIGRGIKSGLNSFILSHKGYSYSSEIIDEFNMETPWSCLHLGLIPEHIVAVVHSPEKELHIP